MAHRVPVSGETSHDPLSLLRVYQLAVELVPDAFKDARLVRAERITEELAGQLYAAVCSIEARISEGYSRSSGKDRARIFEYALALRPEGIGILSPNLVVDRRWPLVLRPQSSSSGQVTGRLSQWTGLPVLYIVET